MISTKNIIASLKDVPKEWVFEYYLNLKEKLTGQDIKILSAFNSKDKVPSMFIYFDLKSDSYKFKDFSSGFQGDTIELIKHLYNFTDRSFAVAKIFNDYQEYIITHKVSEKKVMQFHDKFKVIDFEMRHWTNLDATYWKEYKINSKILEEYNVRPLSYFTMEKKELDTTVTTFKFEKAYMYGYFREDGSLYKIYMPKVKDKKFIKTQNYVQGIDQLKYDAKYLIITSSLKDLMCFKKLNISNVECIAPDSENTMIGESVISKLIPKYSKIIILFDNDEPGIKAAQRYKERYNFDYVVLEMSKDLSDSIKDNGIEVVRDSLLVLLKQKL